MPSNNVPYVVHDYFSYCPKFCRNILRYDGMSYDDYVEQLTYLLFLKMADHFRARSLTFDYALFL